MLNFSRISIKWILPPLLVLPVLIVAIVLTLLAYHAGSQSADDLASQNMVQIRKQIQDHLDRLMEMPPAINELNKRMLASGEMSMSDVDKNRKPVFEVLNIFKAVSSVVVGKATGETMWVIRYPGETTYEYAIKDAPDAKMKEYALSEQAEITGDQLSSYEFQPAVRPWYKAAIAADGPTWGDVYVWLRNGKGETLGVPYVEPYRDAAGQVIGVINCELTLADISSFLQQLKVGKTGKAFILERDGNLVASSTGINCMKDGTSRLPAEEAPDTWIVAASQSLKKQHGSLRKVVGIEANKIEIDGQVMQMVASLYRNRKNLDWLVVTLVPEDDFLAQVKQVRSQHTTVAMVAVGITLLLGVLVSTWLMRPIFKLAEHARLIEAGRLDERIHLENNREMAELSRAINDMVGGLQDRVKLRHALNLAMEVQQALLPNESPNIKGVDVAARAQYCDETGGDYYDYLEMAGIGPNAMVIALGDVMGHGVAAAMLMATARGMLRSHVRVEGSLGRLLTHVNDLLVVDTKGIRFMTMFIGVVDSQTHTLRWASAGHDPPFIYDPVTDDFHQLGNASGLPLGVMEGETYEEESITQLHPGQVLVVGTDGLWESRNEQGEQFGYERLRQTIRELADQDSATIERELLARLKAFCGNQSIEDDVTYIVLKFTEEMDEQDDGTNPAQA